MSSQARDGKSCLTFGPNVGEAVRRCRQVCIFLPADPAATLLPFILLSAADRSRLNWCQNGKKTTILWRPLSCVDGVVTTRVNGRPPPTLHLLGPSPTTQKPDARLISTARAWVARSMVRFDISTCPNRLGWDGNGNGGVTDNERGEMDEGDRRTQGRG